MKKCINCNNINKDKDIYCRNCGLKIKSNSHYILMNVLTFFSIMLLIFVIILFAVLYIMY
jgi:hypothetical protein